MNNFAVLVTIVILWQVVTIAKNPPLPRDRAEIEAVISKAAPYQSSKIFFPKIVLLANVKDHGENEHDYPLWQKRGLYCWAERMSGILTRHK